MTLVVRTQKKMRSMVQKIRIVLDLEYLNSDKQTTGRNRNVKGATGESSEGNKEHENMLLETGGKEVLVTESLAKSCPTIIWKVELVNNKLGYLAEEISKQSAEGAVWVSSCCLWLNLRGMR